MDARHTFTEAAPRFPLHAIDADPFAEVNALSLAWDAMAEAALDFTTDAYARAHSRWNALSGDVG